MNIYPGSVGSKSQIDDYSLPGVMRYLQSEWQHNEGDRIQWELERANMKVKIAQLEGENRGLQFLAEHHAERIETLKRQVISGRDIKNGHGLSKDYSRAETTTKSSGSKSSCTVNYDSLITTELRPVIKSREYLQRCLEEVSYLLQDTEYNNGEYMPPDLPGSSDLDGEFQFRASSNSNGHNVQNIERSVESPYSHKAEPQLDGKKQSPIPIHTDNEDNKQAPFSPPPIFSSPSSPSSRVPTKTTKTARTKSLKGSSTRSTSSDFASMKLGNYSFKKDFTLAGHLDIVRTVEYGSNPYELFTASDDGVIKLWDLKTTKKYETYSNNTYRGHHGIISSLVYSENLRKLYSAGQDATIRVWDPTKTLEVGILGGHSETIWDLSLCDSKGLIASASADGSVKVWNLESKLLTTIDPIKSYTLSEAFTNNDTGDVKSSAESKGNKSYPSPSFMPKYSTEVSVPAITLCFVERGSKIAVGYQDSSIEIYDVETGQSASTLYKSATPNFNTKEDLITDNSTVIPFSSNQINKMVYSPSDSLVFSAFEDGFIRYHDTRSGQTVYEEAHAHLGPVNALSVAPEGGAFVSGGGNQASMKIWSVRERMVVSEFRDHDAKSANSITDVQWCKRTSNGTHVNFIASSGGDSKINVYN